MDTSQIVVKFMGLRMSYKCIGTPLNEGRQVNYFKVQVKEIVKVGI